MTTPPTKPYVTKTGRVVSNADIEALPDEAARLDATLRAAVEERAANDQTTGSDVIREALRRYLDVA